MQQNAILTFFKLVAFTILAVMVFMTFWQQQKGEEVNIKMQKDVSQIKDTQSSESTRQRDRDAAIDKLSGRVDALTEVVQTLIDTGLRVGPTNGGGANVSNGSGGSNTGSNTPKRPVKKMGQDGTRPPSYLGKEAKALWGTYPNYLEEEKDGIPYAEWDTPGLDPNGRFRRWFGSAPSDINPITSSDGVVTTHIQMYTDEAMASLHDLNPAKYGPALAVRVEVNVPDYTEYIVFLRKGAKWHKPQVDFEKYPHLAGDRYVTAHDFAFTLNRCIKNETVNNAWMRSYYGECEGIEVIDDHCFIMRWNKPQFQSISFTLSMAVYPEFVLGYSESGEKYESDEDLGHALNDHWFYRGQRYIGCGPYYMAEFDSSSHMLLRRFEEYFGKLPRLKEIYEEIFPSQELNLKGFEGGTFDATDLTAKQWDLKAQDKSDENPFSNGKIETNWWWTPRYAFIAWNHDHPIFKDIDVRHAMTFACDRERLRDVIQIGRAKIVHGPQPVNSPFYPKDIEPHPFDLEKAKARLAKGRLEGHERQRRARQGHRWRDQGVRVHGDRARGVRHHEGLLLDLPRGSEQDRRRYEGGSAPVEAVQGQGHGLAQLRVHDACLDQQWLGRRHVPGLALESGRRDPVEQLHQLPGPTDRRLDHRGARDVRTRRPHQDQAQAAQAPARAAALHVSDGVSDGQRLVEKSGGQCAREHAVSHAACVATPPALHDEVTHPCLRTSSSAS